MEIEKMHIEAVKSLFSKMGASKEQANIMVSQLLKRAEQISREREITKFEAVEALLKQIIQARENIK